MPDNLPAPESPRPNGASAPLRERSCADHDEPWQYQPYHLTDREKLALWRRRDRMLASEFGRADETSDP
ncbi:MAG: hypothetical protein HY329_11385 [Chloroflexi bacterium]|nr:hypothetical protein [Chloroflexota bacterium]